MITVTNNALDHFKNQGKYVVLYINNKGCSGHSYDIYVTDTITDNLELVKGNFYIDSKFKNILEGSVVDYSRDILSSTLIIKNPNEQSRCGCGESFS